MEIVSNGNRNTTNNARGYQEETFVDKGTAEPPVIQQRYQYKNGFMEKIQPLNTGKM